MRPSLKSLAWAWALPALVSSAAIPPPPGPPGHGNLDNAEATNPTIELDLQDSQATATFSIPCPGCLSQEPNSHDDESLTFSFQAFSSESPCGVSNITLNGRYLAQEWTGDHGHGEGSFEGVSDLEKNEWFRTHDLDLSWGSTCLEGPESKDAPTDAENAQVLTVNIKAIDGRPIPQSSGFTISFKQLSPPELLRLELFPDPTAGDQKFSDSWREPPAHLRLSEGTVEETQLKFHSIEEEIAELKHLQQQAKVLRDQIREKKQRIREHLRHDAASLKAELKQCDSLTCIVKTIARKAHGAVKIIYIRLRPHHPPPPMGGPNDPYHAVWQTHGLPEQIHAVCNGNCSHTPPPPPPPEGHPPGPPPPPPPPPHHGPPHHGHHHGPPPPPHSPLVKALSILASALGLTALVAFLHRRCCTLRARTDRRAAREERRTARQYRRAARRQAWASWWYRNHDLGRIADYEEKRALINEQESILEAAMQEEIRQFRAAHGVVNSLVQAEEGRSAMSSLQHEQLQRQIHMGMEPNSHPAFTIAELPVMSSEPPSRTSSLPDYRSEADCRSESGSTEPPAYEDAEDSSDVVVNGFREYTPSTSTAWTPDSSVVDVSPRPSGETMRVEEFVQKN
ncbi:hypothetical protein BU16DRAFT_521060 [Lophium mytilinum]|uniref:Uncharacterized protein n=1 Tax=Lophium mytilinum TaxID=390894 RepID=A0A6A6RCX6_9PEZI|nr:hypothetical protein BU16DRAFT_521060 [Lophium mytilinum]